MTSYFYFNGGIVPETDARLLVSDLGLLRGFGIFDFFRAIDGQPVFMDDHLARFEASATRLGLPLPLPAPVLRGIVAELTDRNPQPLLGLKMVLTGGYSPDGYTPAAEPNFFIIARPFRFADPDTGLHFMTVEHQRQLPEIKSLDYLMPVHLLPRQRQLGADDVLYHHNGYVTESSRSNVFIIKNETLITPDAGMLGGITRRHLLALAARHMAVEERPVSLQEVLEADEVLTTGSSKRVVPVTRIDGRSIGSGLPGKITHKLYELFLSYEKAL